MLYIYTYIYIYIYTALRAEVGLAAGVGRAGGPQAGRLCEVVE